MFLTPEPPRNLTALYPGLRGHGVLTLSILISPYPPLVCLRPPTGASGEVPSKRWIAFFASWLFFTLKMSSFGCQDNGCGRFKIALLPMMMRRRRVIIIIIIIIIILLLLP